MPSLVNKKTENAKTLLDSIGINYILLGNGNKIIKQIPSPLEKVTSSDMVYLITNDNNITVPYVVGLSGKNAKAILQDLNIKVNLDGVGYVTNQSVPAETPIVEGMEITLNLEPKYQTE